MARQTQAVERSSAESVTDRRSCPECGGEVRQEDATERACSDCGLVVDIDELDRGPEWRSQKNRDTDEPVRCRSSNQITHHDRNIGSRIGYQRGQSSQMRRMHRWNQQAKIRSKKERNLRYALSEIRRLTSVMDLPEAVRERASKLFREAHTADLIRGRSLDAGACAAVYAATREMQLGRDISDFEEIARGETSLIRNAFNAFRRELEIAAMPNQPTDMIPRIASDLDAGHEIESRAMQYAKLLMDRGLHPGNKPSGIAAACIYHASREVGNGRIIQDEIADAAGVSPATLRKQWKRMQDELE